MFFSKKKKVNVKLGGLHCANCVAKVEKAIASLGGKAEIDLKIGRGVITCSEKLNESKIKSEIEALGFTCDIIQ